MIRFLLATLVMIAVAYAACGGDVSPGPVIGGGSPPDSGGSKGIDGGSRSSAIIGAEPMVVGSMPFANGFWAADVEEDQLRFLWVRHIGRVEYFERLYSEGGIGDGAEPRFVVETKFSTPVSLNAVRTSSEWSPLPLFAGANPDRYPIRYLFWSPAQEPVVATICDYAHEYSVGGSVEENEAWLAFEEPCTNECAGNAAVLHRVPLATEPAKPTCLFEDERGGYARRLLLHPEFRIGATSLDRRLRLFEFSPEGKLVREATADNLRMGRWVFWPGEPHLVFEHRSDANPPQPFVPSEIREARIVDGVLEVRTSAALNPLFMSLHAAIATSQGVIVVGQPKPSVDGTGRQLVALVRDGIVMGKQLLPDIGSRPAQIVEVDDALFAFMEGRTQPDAGSAEAPIYGFRLALAP